MSGEEFKFALSPHDYTLQTVWNEKRGYMCLLMVQPVASAPDAPPDYMLLGSPFLRGFYFVLDKDNDCIDRSPGPAYNLGIKHFSKMTVGPSTRLLDDDKSRWL
ncbi:hypothetical protein B0T22DRAFT_494071 [Podospora appendiculata]|uniref:Peptidase A1 domain-containing protein n=1 Tax=Podospora appendiculata TaxID=314037 RepID=A0AAE0X0I4_9PEZI|nr:hypothetical protein B0T22DRAFT_494071 [Podospora appendiculata]